MNAYRIALVATAVTFVLWTAKAVAIGLAGGLDRSPAESGLFLAGLAAFLVAVASLGVALTGGRPWWQRTGAGLLAIIGGFLLTMLISQVVDTVANPGPARHWAWSEVNLWFAVAAIALTLALVIRRQGQQTARNRP